MNEPVRFDDGAAYERFMGKWSQLVATAFLDWVARETGRTLTFVGPASRADTERTTLNGSISGLTAMQALDAVLATTRFRYDVTVPGQLRIELQAADDERVRKIATPKSAAEGKP